MLRTSFHALAAAGTQRGIDDRVEADDLHRSLLAGLFALFTADTAYVAQLSGHAALIMVGTAVERHLLLRHNLDDMPRTRLHAQGAGAALAAVDVRDAVAG